METKDLKWFPKVCAVSTVCLYSVRCYVLCVMWQLSWTSKVNSLQDQEVNLESWILKVLNFSLNISGKHIPEQKWSSPPLPLRVFQTAVAHPTVCCQGWAVPVFTSLPVAFGETGSQIWNFPSIFRISLLLSYTTHKSHIWNEYTMCPTKSYITPLIMVMNLSIELPLKLLA